MKLKELTPKDLNKIRSDAISYFVDSNKGENTHVWAIINSFVDFCKNNRYIVKDGKVFSLDEEEKKSD